MKKFTKVIAVVLVLAALVCVFASCGKKLSGKYSGELNLVVASYKVTYDFKGSNVEVTHTASNFITGSKTTTVEGKYEITESDNGMEITFTFENEDEVAKSATYSFEEGEGYIKINGVQYNVVE
jgi:hypothetical protein